MLAATAPAQTRKVTRCASSADMPSRRDNTARRRAAERAERVTGVEREVVPRQHPRAPVLARRAGKDRLIERGGSAAVAAHPVEHPEERDGDQRHQAGRPRERDGHEAERGEDCQRDERPAPADPVGQDALRERGRRRARKARADENADGGGRETERLPDRSPA